MRIFLKLKHWQLFVLMFVIPCGLQIVNICFMIFERSMYFFSILFPLTMLIYISAFFGWLYSIGINLHKKLPETVPMKSGRFKAFLCIPVIYITLIILTLCMVLINHPNAWQPDSTTAPLIFFTILPIHLFSIFCIFYCLYFVAKSLKAVEVQKPVTFSDYAGEFFLLWFFFIGVWFIQPRINKILGDTGQL